MAGMRAVVVAAHGGPEVLQIGERDEPVAGPGQVVVEVAAAGVNFMDIYQREGRPPYVGNVPYVPGAEAAGTVTEVGSGVTDLHVGDRVAWSGVPGSYAEKVVVPAERAVPVPDGVDLRVAAATLLQGMTAHYLATSTFPVNAGDTVVVHAAAGGTGRLLVQIVKRRGGIVVATTSTPDKAELARSAGADHVTDYESFGQVAREVTGGAGAACVYDGVGKATFDAGLAALRPLGMMVLYGGASGPVPPLELQRLSGGGSLYVTRPTLVHYIATRADLLRRSGDLFEWIARGELEVSVGATYPLAEASRAHDDLANRRTTGKLLLLP
jgi:NADPH2:quinone reductase